MSAAGSIILFLILLILGKMLTLAATVAGWLWWKEHRRRERLQETLQQAQLYAALGGQRLPSRRAPQARPLVVIQRPAPPSRWEVVE